MVHFLGLEMDDFWYEAKYPLNNFWWSGEAEEGENSLGFRGPEFTEAADVVGLGCSFTYGGGVMNTTTWGDFLSEKTNLTYHNISGNGRSVSWAISNFFSYVNRFGNPKVVLALFPEFTRVQLASQPSHMITKYTPEKKKSKKIIIRYPLHEHFNRKIKYFKTPLIAEEIYPPEAAFDLSIQYIKMLEAYCNTNGIKLLWSTWTRQQEEWLEENLQETQFKNFISCKTWEWHARKEDDFYERYCAHKHLDDQLCNSYLDCHKEYEDIYGINFHIADDRTPDKELAHWGVHQHIHLAEKFIKEINDYNPRN